MDVSKEGFLIDGGGVDLEESWTTVGFDDVVDTDDTAGSMC